MISLEDRTAEITDSIEELVRSLIWADSFGNKYGRMIADQTVTDARERLTEAISGLWQ